MEEPVAEVSSSSQAVSLSFSFSGRPGTPLLSPHITSRRRVPFPPGGAVAKGCQMLSPADTSHSACAGCPGERQRAGSAPGEQAGARPWWGPGRWLQLCHGPGRTGAPARRCWRPGPACSCRAEPSPSTARCPRDAAHRGSSPTAAALLHFLFSVLTLPSQLQPFSHMCRSNHWKMRVMCKAPRALPCFQ